MKEDEQIVFGVAKELITPSERTMMIGFGAVFGVPFADIHDDLFVRTLLLQDGAGEKVLLVAMDLLFHDDSLAKALRKYTAEKYGVSEDNLHVSYTHTHFGPAVKGYDFTWYTESYEMFLLERACRCIDRAFLNQHRGTLQFGSVQGEWNISRRLQKDGKMYFRPNPDGECEKNLYLLKLNDESGRMRALVMNFACHASNLFADAYHSISAEYPGRLCQRIEGEFYGCTALFFQGFGSDAKLKAGMKSSAFQQISYDECDEVALSMTARIRNQLLQGKMETLPVQLGSRVFQIELPLDIRARSFYEEQSAYYSGTPGKRFCPKQSEGIQDGRNLLWACADYVLDHYDELPETVTLNCGVIRINSRFYIASMGGEPGCNIGSVLRENLGEARVLCFGYNDAIAYIPSDKMIREGGYEAEGSVTEYRLKGSIRPGVDALYTAGFRRAIDEIGD